MYLWDVLGADKCLEDVSFDVSCKQLKGGYYAKLEHLKFDCSEDGKNNEMNRQGEPFDIALLERAFEEQGKDHIEWIFNISF